MTLNILKEVGVKTIQKKNQGFLHVFAKVQIVDVVSTERCVCQTDEGRFLEGKSRI